MVWLSVLPDIIQYQTELNNVRTPLFKRNFVCNC